MPERSHRIRWDHTVTALLSGEVLVVGGSKGLAAEDVLTSAEVLE